MFKTVATKIAHNSTIPALAGSGDLRPLQDLITAEKAVLTSLQRLSVDFAKASEALRTWGLGEGDDLGDTLSASTTILTHFSAALSQYASHGHKLRELLKIIRTREERLDSVKRHRKSVASSAESAEKKLAKMSPEHKNLLLQQETLNRLRSEIRSLDAEIMAEEASLGDFKRTQTKLWMGLKFGGLLECCEKGTIAGEYGKLVIAEIPEEITPPGIPRNVYYGHSRTEEFVAEAHRRVSEVVLTTVPTIRDPRQEPQLLSNPSEYQHGYAPNAGNWSQINTLGSHGNLSYLPTPQGLGNGQFLDANSPSLGLLATPQPQSPREVPEGFPKPDVNEFGISTSGPGGAGSPSGSRFASHSSRLGPDIENSHMRNDGPPVLNTRHETGPSISSSATDGLNPWGGRWQEPGVVPHQDDTVCSDEDCAAPPSYTPPGGLPPGAAMPAHLQSEYHEEEDAAQGLSRFGSTVSESPVDGGHHDDYASRYQGAHDHDDEERAARSYSPLDMDTERDRSIPLTPIGDSTSSDTRFQSQHRVPPPVIKREDEETLNAAAANEVSREMEAFRFSGSHRDSLPRPVSSTGADLESKSNSPVIGSGASGPSTLRREGSPLLPPVVPFARRSRSPLGQPSQSLPPPSPSQSFRSLSAQNPPSYKQSSPEPPARARVDSFNSPPSPRVLSQSSSTPSYNASGDYSHNSGGSPLSKSSTSLSAIPLPSGGRTISAAAFKRSAPRKVSTETSSIDRNCVPGSPSQSLSPMMPAASTRERANSDSRPLPTPPTPWRDSYNDQYDYGDNHASDAPDGEHPGVSGEGLGRMSDHYREGRFVTNLDDELR
ncbi:hypothetical protein AX17_005998 [Amanita inopinata Kibby_2008]|nr:hypothetical protein AX17_005998 [Amanita inopinata Kibby_2008]